ncbi:MAG: hypothetical protein LBV27_01725, partial [Oscillospiraceae bacterium]|nr:hypothetical protein [Oscillospiraceae bacterium]
PPEPTRIWITGELKSLGTDDGGRVLPRARVSVQRALKRRAAGASTFYSRPQNREKVIITTRALSNARGVGRTQKARQLCCRAF